MANIKPKEESSGGFKWLVLGIHHCIFDADDGRVLGHIITDATNARPLPVRAYVDGKEIGLYINADFAKRAVEETVSAIRRGVYANAGKFSALETSQ